MPRTNGGIIGKRNVTSFGKCTVTSRTSSTPSAVTTQPGTRLVDTLVVAGGGGTSNVASDCIQPNYSVISENYTFTTGYNGVSAGPITIASGYTVTVPAGSAWSIV